ncbi:hypothetical protein ANCCAN_15143 [Ancylostoma caninum]|uniref:Uncharacterized protein n=1 Tax=Ancylostoma caninum TaxID=29170 RepID=A0A368G3B0_ANCCA|nr:hypothetical protein ANCCAN_15143 [Ancylostoma caninum]
MSTVIGFLTDDEVKHKSKAIPAPDFLTDDECDGEHHTPMVTSDHTETEEGTPVIENVQHIEQKG